MAKQDKGVWQIELFPEFYEFFVKENDLLRRLIEHQHNELGHLKDTRLDQLYLLLASIYSCSSAILTLLKNLAFLNDCYMLSRAFLERIINYLYLLSCGEEEFHKFVMYNKYRQVRSFDCELKAGQYTAKLKHTSSAEIASSSEFKKIVDMFTSRKGKPINRWTSRSIPKRLESITNLGKVDIRYLLISVLSIYEDASEALHGTIYGSAFQFGTLQEKHETRSDFIRSVHGNASVLCVQLGTSLHTTFKAFTEISDIHKFLQESDKNMANLSSTLKKINNPPKPNITVQ